MIGVPRVEKKLRRGLSKEGFFNKQEGSGGEDLRGEKEVLDRGDVFICGGCAREHVSINPTKKSSFY